MRNFFTERKTLRGIPRENSTEVRAAWMTLRTIIKKTERVPSGPPARVTHSVRSPEAPSGSVEERPEENTRSFRRRGGKETRRQGRTQKNEGPMFLIKGGEVGQRDNDHTKKKIFAYQLKCRVGPQSGSTLKKLEQGLYMRDHYPRGLADRKIKKKAGR